LDDTKKLRDSCQHGDGAKSNVWSKTGQAAGLVGGRGIFIDACLIKAAVDKKKRVPGDQRIAWPKAEEASRALAQLPERKGGPCVSTVSIVCGICRTSGLLF
jgi:hypothetical protein